MRNNSGQGRLLQGDARQLTETLIRAERFLRKIMGEGAKHILLPGYDLYIWPNSDAFYRTIALPRDRTALDPSVICGLSRAFERHCCVPRIEFFEDRWPQLRETLSTQGIETEFVTTVLCWKTKATGKLQGAELLGASSSPAIIRRFLTSVSSAFGYEGVAGTSEVRRLAKLLAREQAICTWILDGDEPVAGATIVHTDGCGELQGVWAHENSRRQGLALAVCNAALLRFSEMGGGTIWLSAADAASENLYRKLGFANAGRQVNVTLLARQT